MANEKLKAQIWTIDGSTIEPAFDQAQTIDDTLNDSDPTYYVFDWKSNSSLVFWSSADDDPQGEVTHRSKTAIIQYNAAKTTGMTQESWDVAINLPSPGDNQRIIPSRLGESNDFVVLGAGGTTTAPTAFDSQNYELYRTWLDLQDHLNWPANDTDVVTPTNYVFFNRDVSPNIATSENGEVWCNISDHTSVGNKLYVFLGDSTTDLLNDTLAVEIYATTGYYDYPTGSIWVNPYTDTPYYFIAGFDSDLDDGPTVKCLRWNGSTFVKISDIQKPPTDIAEEADDLSWYIGSRSWSTVPFSAAPRNYKYGSGADNPAAVGQPYQLTDTNWLIVAPSYIEYLNDRFVGQGIFKTTDSGVTWTRITVFEPALIASGDTDVTEYCWFSAFSRNIVSFNNKLWIAFAMPAGYSSDGVALTSDNWTIAPIPGHQQSAFNTHRPYTQDVLFFYSEDDGETWKYSSKFEIDDIQILSVEMFVDQDPQGDETMYILVGGAKLYSMNADPTGYLDMSDYVSLLREYEYIPYNQTHNNAIVSVDNNQTGIIAVGSVVLGSDRIELDFHNGVSAYIVDQCSS